MTIVIIANYTRGLLAQIPLLFGIITGCVVALLLKNIGAIDLFRTIPNTILNSYHTKFDLYTVFSLPRFSLPKPSIAAVIAIMPMAIATIPESVSHVYQMDTYINDLAKRKGKERLEITGMLDMNLIGDGIGDILSGLMGGPAGTSYGENISVMTISSVFSSSVLITSAVLICIISCITPIIRLIYCIPIEVIGGLELYMFGAISVQGIALMIENKVDLFNTRVVSVVSAILVIGIGGSYYFEGTIPFFTR